MVAALVVVEGGGQGVVEGPGEGVASACGVGGGVGLGAQYDGVGGVGAVRVGFADGGVAGQDECVAGVDPCQDVVVREQVGAG